MSKIKINEDEKELIKVYLNQLNIMTQTLKNIHILRHDLMHHVRTLYSLAIKSDNTEIMVYLEKMEASIVNMKEHVYSGNPDIDGILNYMIEKAKQVLDNVEVKIKIPQELNIYSFELTVILGNLIENAIEASKKSDEKILKLEISMEKGLLFIKVTNKYIGNICISDNKIISSKKNQYHGLGLESVKEIVERHHGNMNVLYDKDMFEVNIMLYLSELK